MTEPSEAPSESDRPNRDIAVLPAGLMLVGLINVAIGVWMLAGPSSFYDRIGTYGSLNPHYIRDLGSFTVAEGAAFFVAVWWRSWRIPVLCLALVQAAIHALNHFADIGDTDPKWLGTVNFIAVTASVLLLVYLISLASRAPRTLRDNAESTESTPVDPQDPVS